MKPNAKKISVVRELHEIIIVRRQNQIQLFCRDCRENVDFLSLDEAVNFLQTGTREILSRIETGEVHSSDTPNGQMLICAKSPGAQATYPYTPRYDVKYEKEMR